jgi:hypothetical protein
MRLRVLEGGSPQAVDAYRGSAFDLTVHPLRPGFAHEAVELTVDAELAEAVERAAATEGLPTMLWAALAIESERALHAHPREAMIAVSAIEDKLDAAARATTSTAAAPRGRRLTRYALALRRGTVRAAGTPQRRLTLAVPHHTVIAWELAAVDAQQALGGWARARLARLPAGRPRWEAAAALAGQTLGEWIAVQAARRSSD